VEVPQDREEVDAASWVQRDRQVNESNTINGGSGLLKTQHAQSGAPGQLRLGFATEWFSAGFLCTAQFPCPNSSGGPAVTSDTMSHVGGTLSVGASLFKIGSGTFEGYGSIMAYANNDSANSPSLLQVLGDMNLGVKYAAPVGSVVNLGLFTELWLINGTGSVGLDSGATSAKFGGLFTADLRGLEARVPLRFSANVVYFLDNTGDVLTDTENARGQPVTRIERFGLGVNRVDQVDFLIGGEGLLLDERIRPFVETKIVVPNNHRQGYECRPNNPSADNCLQNDNQAPATLTVGGRFFPWKRGFSLLAAVDIGLSGMNDFIEELSPTPPWMLYLGAGWAIDTQDRPPVTKIVEKVIERAPPKGHVAGFVHENDRNEPIAGALVTYRDRSDLSPLSTGADGKFGDDVAPGAYTYDIKADGYKPGSCDASVPKEGGNITVDCPLESLPRVGAIVGRVRSADTNQPLGGVPLVVVDAQRKEIGVTSDPSGAFRAEGVSPGTSEISVMAEGFLVLAEPLDVKSRQDNQIDLALRAKPKTANVRVTPNEITIRQQVQFALDSVVILPESFGLLTEIADILIRHPEIKRVEVQGHTDNTGTPEHNQSLSEGRAEAIRGWLVQHGVQPDRLMARGYGQDKPLVPNVTAANRATNRRVQFIIVDKDAAPPPPAQGPPKKNILPGF
jgi:outer membrane protein OmpA-like peptidoglycan-associated protein